ncbi:YihY/virulence factor BrkB family protein [Adhaeribacter aquaticus]|uniref:YihY/virulence factor BrkB family protein n=1 Tax=Adhaeribacter aquaticus TaxID=299567 RepID=UPI000424003E|nr:YihY/virulence factor BrkB family protein [Adhaeribacter aquaticus]
MITRQRVRVLWFLLKDAFREFKKNDPLRFGSSTAFFTTFALPPILVILTNLFGLLINVDFISLNLIIKLQTMVGQRGATQLYYVLQNIQDIPTHWSIATTGMLFLMFVSTTLFIVVQKSINELWSIKPKSGGKKIRKLIKNRAISLAIILATGLLFLISLLADSALSYMGNNLNQFFPDSTTLVIHVVNQVFSILFVTVWFAITFKYLPDAHIHWKPIWVGAGVTAVLFTIGKFILNRMLINSNLGPIYGPSASVLLIMLFVFYSAMILFYGASFTKTYANYALFKVKPKSYAMRYEPGLKEKEKPKQDLPPGASAANAALS